MSDENVSQYPDIRTSLFQAGMGGVAGVDLACSVSNAGAAGCVGAYKLSGGDLETMLRRLCSKTSQIVGVNLIPQVVGTRTLLEQVRQVLAETPERVYLSFFGNPEDSVVELVNSSSRQVLIQIGNVSDGARSHGLGAIVVAQGYNAGGHLLGNTPRDTLVSQLRDRCPDAALLAAGGIGSALDVHRSILAGADGILMGTQFVACDESQAHDQYKLAVIGARSSDTVVSTAYNIGWPGTRHRTLRSRVTDDPSLPAKFIGRTQIGGKMYPIPRFSAAVPTRATSGKIEEMALYCGTSCDHVSNRRTASEVVAEFASYIVSARCEMGL